MLNMCTTHDNQPPATSGSQAAYDAQCKIAGHRRFTEWLSEHRMPLFQGRSSLLEVQNRALIKTAKDRAVRIDELQRDLQQAKNEVSRWSAISIPRRHHI
jgi:hypothetical protein